MKALHSQAKSSDPVSEMYETGVLVENPSLIAKKFRERMGYVDPRPDFTANVEVNPGVVQAALSGRSLGQTLNESRSFDGTPVGQDEDTLFWQSSAMNPPDPENPLGMTMTNAGWQTAPSVMGGNSGTIQMKVNRYTQILPIANNNRIQVMNNAAYYENRKQARRNPFSNAYAADSQGFGNYGGGGRPTPRGPKSRPTGKDGKDPIPPKAGMNRALEFGQQRSARPLPVNEQTARDRAKREAMHQQFNVMDLNTQRRSAVHVDFIGPSQHSGSGGLGTSVKEILRNKGNTRPLTQAVGRGELLGRPPILKDPSLEERIRKQEANVDRLHRMGGAAEQIGKETRKLRKLRGLQAQQFRKSGGIAGAAGVMSMSAGNSGPIRAANVPEEEQLAGAVVAVARVADANVNINEAREMTIDDETQRDVVLAANPVRTARDKEGGRRIAPVVTAPTLPPFEYPEGLRDFKIQEEKSPLDSFKDPPQPYSLEADPNHRAALLAKMERINKERALREGARPPPAAPPRAPPAPTPPTAAALYQRARGNLRKAGGDMAQKEAFRWAEAQKRNRIAAAAAASAAATAQQASSLSISMMNEGFVTASGGGQNDGSAPTAEALEVMRT